MHVVIIWRYPVRGSEDLLGTCPRESWWPKNLPSRPATGLFALWLIFFFFFFWIPAWQTSHTNNLPQLHYNTCFISFHIWYHVNEMTVQYRCPSLSLFSPLIALFVFRLVDREACVWHWAGWTPEKEWKGGRPANRGLCHDASRDWHERRGKEVKTGRRRDTRQEEYLPCL